MDAKHNAHRKEGVPDPDEIRERYPIEDDSDSLEPFDDGSEHREINADDPHDISYWANQFQIAEEDLKAAIVLNGNSIKDIKKFLSV